MFDSIYEREFTILGNSITVRFEPKEFKQLVKKISRLIDNEDYELAKKLVDENYFRWNGDPELIRLNTFISFMNFEKDFDETII